MGRLEHECKRALLPISLALAAFRPTCQLLDDRLDQLGEVETLVRLALVDVLAQDGDRLGVGVGLERVAPLGQDVLELFVVGDDTVVHQAELRNRVADVRVAVDGGGDTVRRPSSVGHRGLRDKHFRHVNLGAIAAGAGQGVGDRLVNVLSQRRDLADFLEENDGRVGCVAVDSDPWGESRWRSTSDRLTGRVVSSVLETGETVAQYIAHVLAVLLHEEGAVSKDSYGHSGLGGRMSDSPHMFAELKLGEGSEGESLR